MKREEVLKRLGFHVPEGKQKRVIIHSDVAAEADDQFAIVHHLLTPSEHVVGIIAANFEWRFRTIPALKNHRLESMEKSYAEAKKLLELMEIDDVPVYRGAPDHIADRKKLPVSEGSEFIIREAMKEEDSPLYIALQGTLTDLAVAYLTKPEIAERITAAIWIGGGAYPNGGRESNLQQDVYAAQVLFDSPLPIWQIPMNVYAGMNLTFAELMQKVNPAGAIGEHLCDTMFKVNDWYGAAAPQLSFPHGEVWSIGDQPTISALLEPESGRDWVEIPAPTIEDDMRYAENPDGKKIKVFQSIDRRMLMDDFFAKLELAYGHKK